MNENVDLILSTLRNAIDGAAVTILQTLLPNVQQTELPNDVMLNIVGFMDDINIIEIMVEQEEILAVILPAIESYNILNEIIVNNENNVEELSDNDDEWLEEGDDGLLAVWDAPNAIEMHVDNHNEVVDEVVVLENIIESMSDEEVEIINIHSID